MNSLFLRLGQNDIVKGTITAFFGALVTALYTLIDSGVLPTSWVQLKPVLMGAVLAGLSYLLKNFFTNSAGKIGPEPPK